MIDTDSILLSFVLATHCRQANCNGTGILNMPQWIHLENDSTKFNDFNIWDRVC